jgi:hypothetical protein
MKTLRTSLLIAALLLAGCTPTTTLSTSLTVLSDACEAATVAIPLLESTGVIQPGVGNIVLAYTAAVSKAASESSAELLTTDSTAVKGTKIIGYFAGITVPALGPSVGPEVQALVNAITGALQAFLVNFTSPSAKAAIASGQADRFKLSSGDRHAIGGLQKKLAGTAAKAQGLIKK